MDISSNRSQDEDRVMQRQLYRAGQSTQPAPKPGSPPSRPAPSAAAKPKHSSGSSDGQPSAGQRILGMILLLGVGYFLLYGTPSQRRKTFIGLGVAMWLLLLGGISYCLCLPDLEGLNRERMALWQDQNLTPEERVEKAKELREREKNLTPAEREQLRQIMRKEFTRKNNGDMYNFLKMSPEEQVAQLKKEAEERRKRFEEMRKMWGDKGWPKGGNRGGGQNGGNKGGGGGGGGPGGGGGWGGPGGGGRDDSSPEAMGKQLDSRSPEARAGGAYKMGLMQKLGLGFGGRGGPGGPPGGPGGGGGGRSGGGR